MGRMMTQRMMRAPLAMLLLAGLGGCVSLSGGGEPPETLLTLSADARIAADTARTSADAHTLAVLTPTVPETLANDRIAVQTGDNSFAYIKDARWADQPARLFADLLAETIGARTGRLILDRRQLAATGGERLTGRLQSFGLDAGRGEVVVIYDATLLPRDGGPVLSRRFEARVATPSEKAPAVARALNRAANGVAGQVADWVGP